MTPAESLAQARHMSKGASEDLSKLCRDEVSYSARVYQAEMLLKLDEATDALLTSLVAERDEARGERNVAVVRGNTARAKALDEAAAIALKGEAVLDEDQSGTFCRYCIHGTFLTETACLKCIAAEILALKEKPNNA